MNVADIEKIGKELRSMPASAKVIAPGVVVLGHYDISVEDARLIGTHLLDMTSGLVTVFPGGWNGSDWYDFGVNAEVRGPATNLKVRKIEAARREQEGQVTAIDWHHDAVSTPLAVVVWANKETTEIKLADGTVIRPDSGDVVILKDSEVMHRSPEFTCNDRWFFRRMVRVPEWL